MFYKRVLIISPHFPPSNAPEMQRIRMSLPYFEAFGWKAEVVTVHEKYSHVKKDERLLENLPKDLKVHKVGALPYSITKFVGLGSIALRSIIFYFFKVNEIVNNKKIDLIYFSTTQFPVCVLGAYWKWRYSIPYVIDMQDPWHSDYYLNKPKKMKPPKYWFSYRLNRFLEPIAMNNCDGLISVSQKYLDDLSDRYPVLQKKPKKVITFAVSEDDYLLSKNLDKSLVVKKILEDGKINIVYVGVCGPIMKESIERFFGAIAKIANSDMQIFKRLKLSFIGTSYARKEKANTYVTELAKKFKIEEIIYELTDRVSFYEMFQIIDNASILFIPGTDDPGYTASKLFPYLMVKKPIIAIFHPQSSSVSILEKCTNVKPFTLDENYEIQIERIYATILNWIPKLPFELIVNQDIFVQYTARTMTKEQVELFEKVIKPDLFC